MRIFSKLRTSMLKAIGLFLASDETDIPQEQIEYIKDHAFKQRKYIHPKDSEELLKNMEAKHSIESICVSSKHGSVILASEEYSKENALTGVAMFNYIQSESPKSEGFFIKESRSWQMVYPYKEKIYLIKAHDHLTNIELRRIAEEVETFLIKNENDQIAKEIEVGVAQIS